ncbi:MAG: hypothetical protein ABI165_17330 [Bryobacteraceae bacterium]
MTAVAVVAAFAPVYATTLTYSSLSSFQAAANGLSTITFDNLGVPVGGTHDYSTSLGLTTGPAGNQAQFVGYDGSVSANALAVDNETAGFAFWGSVSPNAILIEHVNAPNSTSYITVNLPANTTAVGLDLMTAFSYAQTVSVTPSNGVGTFNIPTKNNPTETFWGLTTDTPIGSLQIQVPTGTYDVVLDNFTYGQADTPEVMTLILIGTGLILFRGLKKLQPGRAGGNRTATFVALSPRPAQIHAACGGADCQSLSRT